MHQLLVRLDIASEAPEVRALSSACWQPRSRFPHFECELIEQLLLGWFWGFLGFFLELICLVALINCNVIVLYVYVHD